MEKNMTLETVLILDQPSWRENTARLQSALDEISATGGGILSIRTPKEGAEIGAIQLPSHVTLHVCQGSTLKAALERQAYETARWECLIESHGTIGVSITGGGVIDGRGIDFMEADLTYIYRPKYFRPRLIAFFGCEDIIIRDIILRDGAFWTLHPIGCKRVLIEGITIDNDLKVPNCDGIDPDRCQDVRISDCMIHCADDCIVLKTTKEFSQFEPTRRITITGCTLISTSAAIKIGTESVADFSDIVITGCTITDSSRGIALQLRDQGNIERVIISDCTITTRLFDEHYWGRAEPVYITALPRFGVEGEEIPEWNPENRVGTIRDVTISNIRCCGENGVVVYGIEREDGSRSVEDLRLKDIDLRIERKTRWPAGRRDLRPCDTLGPLFRDPSKDPGLQLLDHHGLSIEGTKRVAVQNLSVLWGTDGLEGFATAVYLKNNRSLFLQTLQIEEV